MLPCENEAYELDLTKLGDEELVVLAAECQYHPAEQALLLRYYVWSQRLIARLARRYFLTPSDVEDAGQDTVFAIVRAIARYDTLELGKINGCPFRAFLRRVMSDRFKDFVRQLRRHTSDTAKAAIETNARTRPACREVNPATAAASTELRERLVELLDERDGFTRDLLQGIMNGMRLRAIAENLGTSYDSIKRHWRKERDQLARQFDERVKRRPASCAS
jgi:RNA polymerase sigma factor (sigma-70 family)